MSHVRQDRIEIRAFAEEKAAVARAAELLHTTLSNFVRDTIMSRTEEVLREHEKMVLTDRDRDLFMKALDNPPKPNKNLRSAMKEHLKKTRR